MPARDARFLAVVVVDVVVGVALLCLLSDSDEFADEGPVGLVILLMCTNT